MTAPPQPTVLILGGTGEARALAEQLVPVARVISSLAGRVARPRLPVGDVRIGGFGGPAKLAEWLAGEAVGCVVDATHPFAERISASAAAAAAQAGVPLLRLQRPGWRARPGDDWTWVDGLDEAAALIAAAGPQRVFVTSGRQGLGAFAGDARSWFLVRCVDPPEPADLPAQHEVLLDRGPYTLRGELGLLDTHRIDTLVTKDSGGALTVAKLDAMRERGRPVLIVRRPPPPAGVPFVDSAEEAARWALAQLGDGAAAPR